VLASDLICQDPCTTLAPEDQLIESHVLHFRPEQPGNTARLNLDIDVGELVELPVIGYVLADRALELSSNVCRG
jgi:hypothetical protein